MELVMLYPIGASSHTLMKFTLFTTGVGFTLTVRVMGVPGHPFTEGVIIYSTSTGSVPVLSRYSLMGVPVPDPAGLAMFPTAALVQLKSMVPIVEEVVML